MARGRGRPPKGRPPGGSLSAGDSFDTIFRANSHSGDKTHSSIVRSSPVLNAQIDEEFPPLIPDFPVPVLPSSVPVISSVPVPSTPVISPSIPVVHSVPVSSVSVISPSVQIVSSVPVISSVPIDSGEGGIPKTSSTTNSSNSASPTKPSWVEVATCMDQQGMCVYYSGESSNSEEVDIVIDDIKDELKLWEFILMGNILGAKPTLKQMTDFVANNWGHIASPIVQYYRRGWFSFKFSSLNAMNSVLKEGPWRLGSNSIILKQWSYTFSFEMDKVSVVPIWILFTGLDPYLWSDVVLSKMASKVGKPLFADKTTASKSRLSFARIMVEVDVAAPLPEYVWINTPFSGSYAQQIEYEWVPYYCKECGKLGHLVDTCKVRKKKLKEADQVVKPSSKPVVESHTEAKEGSGCQMSGGTSDSDLNVSDHLEPEGDSGCSTLGLSSSPLIVESSSQKAVTHSGSSELGHFSPFRVDSSCLVVGSVTRSQVGQVVVANSFGVLSSDEGANDIDVFGILETRTKANKASRIFKSVFSSYHVLTNYEFHSNGRIWVLWNPTTVSVSAVVSHAQVIHFQLCHHGSGVTFQVSIVYACNDAKLREELWSSLSLVQPGLNWIVMGDFNVVRDIQERANNTLPILFDILSFNQCILNCGLDDLQSTGCEFTWTNKQDGVARVWSKLDRVMVNCSWLQTFPSTTVHFLPSCISDHSPTLGRLGNIKTSLDCCQLFLQTAPSDVAAIQQEKVLLQEYIKFKKVEISILYQRANLKNVLLNDSNTKFFHAKISKRRHSQIIGSIEDHNGVLKTGNSAVVEGFTEYYRSLLGTSTHVADIDPIVVSQGACVDESDWPSLFQPVLDSEIYKAFASIDPNSSPGLDGFSSAFFISSWNIIKDDLYSCVREFFLTSHMAKQANTTLITLISKKKTVQTVMAYFVLFSDLQGHQQNPGPSSAVCYFFFNWRGASCFHQGS
ncbi:hypothetical protein RND81_01G187800 [Saponaria officinalis]|uniref:DUF4283 domain-containing protein n=1 Tax=Saponaria officinalis TaxID=3572 RepID=A0AAW1NAX0_SAPOF